MMKWSGSKDDSRLLPIRLLLHLWYRIECHKWLVDNHGIFYAPSSDFKRRSSDGAIFRYQQIDYKISRES